MNHLRAKLFKKAELLQTSCLTLKKNTPKLIDKSCNSHVILLKEEEENESLYIHSAFSGDEYAFIGNEFQLNFLEDAKKVDFMYIFFSKDKKAHAYLYDMKKTFSGIDVILKLVGQWKSSIEDVVYCVGKLDEYELTCIKIGVITEKDDKDQRKLDLEPILKIEDIPAKLPTFMKSKHLADNTTNAILAKKLSGFLEGKITINGHTYKYDIRKFVDKKHDMYFNDGILKEEFE